ncbi:MAG: putative metalloprotease with PDZ domain [Bacteroidia bacterium]|jgi:predicted metalloprotease with PDZ domain
MNYSISFQDPHNHFIDIEARIDTSGQETLKLQLPAWRPGRYELANFAKNIQKWDVSDDKGVNLKNGKISKDCWEINCADADEVVVRYNFYANELNGGSTYLDSKQLYVNPINCFLYEVGKEDESCALNLEIPDDYQVATGLKREGGHWSADSFHQLVDCPFIASASLQHGEYVVNGVLFHLWFQGEFKPDWERIIHEFSAFTKVQMDVMGGFPVNEYHFLFQITTALSYHGVEHSNSTVVLLGPSYDILKPAKWLDFLGVSSHELFHTWNVKAIRPIEMQPYDYSKENYTKLGYVTEGVTTYYGDLFLYRSKGFTDSEYFKELHQLFQRHFHNYGRFNLSVADSSYDTWLDGYVKGIPHRKTSIYTEGAMVALLLDLSIRKETDSQKSLDDVIRLMNERFGITRTGYSESDYLETVNDVVGSDYSEFFNTYYYGTPDLLPKLEEMLAFVGLEIKDISSKLYFENRFGFKVNYVASRSARITDVAPDSIADNSKMKIGDEIVSINGIRILGNLNDWFEYFQDETVSLAINGEDDTHKVNLTPTEERYYRSRLPQKMKNASDNQKRHFEGWTSRGY